MEIRGLYSSIFTRKSTRDFDPSPLHDEMLLQIDTFVSGVRPLLAGPKVSHRIAARSEVKGLGLPNAPHYILISGEKHPMRNLCAGFLYQHAELYINSMGLAARWIASAKSRDGDPHAVLGIAFGRPAVPETRIHADFDRLPLADISQGCDSRIAAARVAPSGLNKQPWYFAAEGGVIHAYRKKRLGGVLGLIYNMTDVDLGIALCHLAVASEHEGKPFNFTPDKICHPTPPRGFEYVGTVG